MTLSTGNQLKAARALLGLSQLDVAKRAEIDVNTVRNLESSAGAPISGRAETVRRVQLALESAGVEFQNHGQPGVRLKKASQPVSETIDPAKLNSRNDG